jgi:hypothetical protein
LRGAQPVQPVFAGLDPAIHHLRKTLLCKMDDTRVKPAYDDRNCRCNAGLLASSGAYAAGTGSAVTDLIFSIANREVTFFSGTALISFL